MANKPDNCAAITTFGIIRFTAFSIVFLTLFFYFQKINLDGLIALPLIVTGSTITAILLDWYMAHKNMETDKGGSQ